MLVEPTNQPEPAVVALCNAVFCLDCKVISDSQGDECRACKSRSLLSLARILSGSLSERRLDQEFESGSFDITLTIELRQMCAKDVNTTLENLTNVIGSRLALGLASFHVNVQPTLNNSFHKAA